MVIKSPVEEIPAPPDEEQHSQLRTQNPKFKTTLVASFKYAFAGIWYSIRTQRNMQIHVGLGTLLVIVGLIFGISTLEWAILAGMMGLIYALEIVNTAIEAVVDMVTQKYHPLAKVAKDAGAGAVLIAAIFAVVVALFIFVPRFLHFVFRT